MRLETNWNNKYIHCFGIKQPDSPVSSFIHQRCLICNLQRKEYWRWPKPGRNQGSSPRWLVVDTFVKIHFLPRTYKMRRKTHRASPEWPMQVCKSECTNGTKLTRNGLFSSILYTQSYEVAFFEKRGTNGLLICHVTVTHMLRRNPGDLIFNKPAIIRKREKLGARFFQRVESALW